LIVWCIYLLLVSVLIVIEADHHVLDGSLQFKSKTMDYLRKICMFKRKVTADKSEVEESHLIHGGVKRGEGE